MTSVMTDSELMSEVVSVLETRFTELLNDATQEYSVLTRTLRPTDPNQAIGIFASDWAPFEDSMEMGGPGVPAEPTISRYNFRIQNMVKAANEVEGRQMFARDAKIIRAILYRDQALAVRLRDINEVTLDSSERVMRYGVQRQRFLNNEIRGSFLYLATTELWVDTATVPV